MAPLVKTIPEDLELEVGEETSSTGDYEEVMDLEGVVTPETLETAVNNPVDRVAQEPFVPPVPTAIPIIDPREEEQRCIKVLAAQFLANQKQLLDLAEDKRCFEVRYGLQKTEILAKHGTAMLLVGELSREVTGLEKNKPTLQRDTIDMEEKEMRGGLEM